jgi:heme exporter protein A
VLETRELTCVRGERTLFERLSFSVRRGEALHVAGANGSGKTSLLRMLCGLSQPAEGDILWDGHSIRKVREEFHQQLVYIGHANAIKDDLTAAENVVISTMLAAQEVTPARAQQALVDIGLGGREDLPAKVLSQGQRRRVALARLLLELDVPLWILDEPFTALDVRAVGQLRATMERHLARGGMVIFTTHQDVPLDTPSLRRLELD